MNVDRDSLILLRPDMRHCVTAVHPVFLTIPAVVELLNEVARQNHAEAGRDEKLPEETFRRSVRREKLRRAREELEEQEREAARNEETDDDSGGRSGEPDRERRERRRGASKQTSPTATVA